MDRSYGEGVEKALFLLSRGYCYKPGCNRPVVLLEGADEPRVDVQIAHICALNSGGPRFEDPTFPLHERNMFKNLLLLCKPHHDDIDNIRTRGNYPVAKLLDWKRQREGDLAEQLRGLSNLTEASLQTMIGSAIGDVRNELLLAIRDIGSVNADTAGLLRDLVLESFDRPYLDPDVVATLAHSARQLSILEDYGHILYESARSLRLLEDHGSTLYQSAISLQALEKYGHVLYESNQAFGILERHNHTLQDFTKAVDSLPNLYGIHGQLDGAESAGNTLLKAARSIGALEPLIRSAETISQNILYANQTVQPEERRVLLRNGFLWGVGFILAVQVLGIVLFKLA